MIGTSTARAASTNLRTPPIASFIIETSGPSPAKDSSGWHKPFCMSMMIRAVRSVLNVAGKVASVAKCQTFRFVNSDVVRSRSSLASGYGRIQESNHSMLCLNATGIEGIERSA